LSQRGGWITYADLRCRGFRRESNFSRQVCYSNLVFTHAFFRNCLQYHLKAHDACAHKYSRRCVHVPTNPFHSTSAAQHSPARHARIKATAQHQCPASPARHHAPKTRTMYGNPPFQARPTSTAYENMQIHICNSNPAFQTRNPHSSCTCMQCGLKCDKMTWFV
jgi:hypothetical protein